MLEIGEVQVLRFAEHTSVDGPVQPVKHAELNLLFGRELHQVIRGLITVSLHRKGTVVLQGKRRIAGRLVYLPALGHAVVVRRSIFQSERSFQYVVLRHRTVVAVCGDVRFGITLKPAVPDMIVQHLPALPSEGGGEEQSIERFYRMVHSEERILVELQMVVPEERTGYRVYPAGLTAFRVVIGGEDSSGEGEKAPVAGSIAQGKLSLSRPLLPRGSIIEGGNKAERGRRGEFHSGLQLDSQPETVYKVVFGNVRRESGQVQPSLLIGSPEGPPPHNRIHHLPAACLLLDFLGGGSILQGKFLFLILIALHLFEPQRHTADGGPIE